MKKSLILLCVIILLAACERPATFSNWSPISDLTTLKPTSSETLSASIFSTTITPSNEAMEAATPYPALDLSKFPNPLPESMKGYELVSWQVGDDWNFTLITGTNRSKTFEELMAPDSTVSKEGFVKITVSGVDAIKRVLSMLPSKTEVFWSGMNLEGQVPEGTLYFAYPAQEIMDDLIAFAATHNVNLEVLVDPGQ